MILLQWAHQGGCLCSTKHNTFPENLHNLLVSINRTRTIPPYKALYTVLALVMKNVAHHAMKASQSPRRMHCALGQTSSQHRPAAGPSAAAA